MDDALIIAGVVLHGPVDMTLTALSWPLEANPFVVHMGLEPWLVFKTLLLMGLVLWYGRLVRPAYVDDESPDRRVRAALAAFAGLGAGVMVLNLTTLYSTF